MRTRQCQECGKIKDITEFYQGKYHKDRIAIYCKKCCSEMFGLAYEEHDDGQKYLKQEKELNSKRKQKELDREREKLDLKQKQLDEKQEELDFKQEQLDRKQKELDDKQN